jgi:2-polyprenyl-3-methyl-5-hydroxy-6-metoxy-1,4-benzoquinol methylase
MIDSGCRTAARQYRGREEGARMTGVPSREPAPDAPAAASRTGSMGALPQSESDAARLGNPSFVWRSGQERRMALIEPYVPLEGQLVLDLGCGLGEYVRAFARRGAYALGSDIATDRLVQADQRVRETGTSGVAGFLAHAGEAMPFRDGSLDVIVLNEVIEHVEDDRATLREIARALRPGGTCILYAPNRLYPFETHGIYWRGRYIFGNIPLVNWLPTRLRNRLVPHARAYRHGDWARLIQGTSLRIVDQTYVYPGFDNIEARSPRLARFVRRVCYWAEHNPLRRFGLSHLVVLQREAPADRQATPAPIQAVTS